MSLKYLFDKDIFLKTDFPIAFDSPDHINPHGGTQHDYTDGSGFADYLLKHFPYRKALIDLGCATGHVPLTMRETGMLAIGLEGSDKSKKRKLSAWELMPDIVRTCDISRPFKIVDKNDNPVKFDFITSWGVFEHVHSCRLDILWQNIRDLMHDESIGIFNIDLGMNEWHLSGGWSQKMWQKQIEDNFYLMKNTTFDDNGNFKFHPYCRPTKRELEYANENELPFYSGRTYWWVKLKK